MRQESSQRVVSRGNGVVQKRSGKKKKFKNTRLYKILRVLLLLIILIVIVNIIKNIVHKTPDKVSLVIGDKNIKLKNEIEIDKNNNIFVSIDDIKDLYDKNIYYSNNILITTYNKHIAVLEMGKTTMKINDVVQEIKGTLKEKNGIIYLPFSDMSDVYDFEASYNKDTKILSVDSKSLEKKEAVVLKNCKLKESTKMFAKTIEKIKKTEYVTVFGIEGKFTRIRTSDGSLGYVKTKKLATPEVLWENMEDEKLKNVNVLEDYNSVNSGYEVLQDVKENSVVTPNLFKISLNSENKIEVQKILSFENDMFKSYQDWANQSGINICPVVTLDCSMSKVCESYESRSLVINTLYNDLVKNNLNMICIDFREIDDIEGLYRFTTEMVPRFKSAGMKVLIKYNDVLNKDRLNTIVDFVID